MGFHVRVARSRKSCRRSCPENLSSPLTTASRLKVPPPLSAELAYRAYLRDVDAYSPCSTLLALAQFIHMGAKLTGMYPSGRTTSGLRYILKFKDAALMALPYRIFGNCTVRYTSYSILLRRCLNTLGWCICLFGHRSVRLNRPNRGYLEAIQRLNRNANISRCARIFWSVESYEVNRVNTVLWRNSVMPYVYGTTYAVFYAVAASLI